MGKQRLCWWPAKRASMVLVAAFALWTMASSPTHAGDCRCRFADTKWEAYATDVACSIWMHKGKTSCEIEFGGLGTNEKLLSSVRGGDAAEYRRQTFDVLNKYLSYVAANDIQGLTTPQFLSQALPIFMGGAFLRGSQDDAETVNKARRLDGLITSFVSKYSDRISDVFRGLKPEFRTDFDKANFVIGKGFVVLDDGDDHIETRYLPGS